jgi:hypothetical protein
MRTRGLIFINVILATVLTILASGCAKTGNSVDKSQPPEIPSQSTFVMDFGDFMQSNQTSNLDRSALMVSLFQDSTPVVIGTQALGDRSNWTFAALNVGFWNLVGVVGLAIPMASFVASINQTPVKQPDNSWVWTDSITVQGITYTAELHGKYISSGVRWDMYISKQNDFTDFLWYYGETNNNNTSGFWVLKEKPSKSVDLLRIDWHRNSADETGDIKYTNIQAGGADNGGYISFVVNKQAPYDRSYTIFNKSKNETTDIEWSVSTKAGRVKDSQHFGDSNWHYWDSSLKNTTSP